MDTMNSKVRFDMVLPIILLSYFMILLDNSIIFTGTVKIAQDLRLNQAQLSWVSNAYSLTFGGLLLFGGRSGDIFGRKKMFNIGLILFGIGSLLVGVAGSALPIIAARAFQGIGSAILAPTTLAILMDNYHGEARTKAVAAYGATAGVGASVGLVIGGILASTFSWRDGFFINVPISIMMLVLASLFIKKRPTIEGTMDLIGSITSVVGMVSLVYSIVGERDQVVALVMAIIFLSWFVVHEGRTASPMMPLSLFKDKERLGAYLARFLFMGAMLSLWFLTPQLMQNYFGYTPLQAGVAFFPLTIAIFLSSLRVSFLTAKWGNTKLLIIGLFITTIGMIYLAFFNETSTYWTGIAIPMIIIGIGQGFALSPLTAAGIANTTPDEAGAASGVVNMVHQIGGSIGLSLIIALTNQISDQVLAYQIQMALAAFFIAGAFIFSIWLIAKKHK